MAASNDQAMGKATTKLSKQDYGLICTWLEIPGNRQKVDGIEKKTTIGGKSIVKAKGLAELAKFVNDNQLKGSTLKEVTGSSMKTRYKHYFNHYRDAKEECGKTGYGLTEEDQLKGINTIEEKLEKLCPYFERMDAIFGQRSNVHIFARYESGPDFGADAFPWVNQSEENDIGLNDLDHTENMIDQDLHDDDYADETQAASVENIQMTQDQAWMEGTPTTNVRVDDYNESPYTPLRPHSPLATPTVTGTAQLRRSRSRPVSESRENLYPSKKKMNDTRHSINSAFANNLATVAQQKDKAISLKEKKNRSIHRRRGEKLAFEWVRLESEMKSKKQERREKIKQMESAEKSAERIAILSSSRPIEEIKLLFGLLEAKPSSLE